MTPRSLFPRSVFYGTLMFLTAMPIAAMAQSSRVNSTGGVTQLTPTQAGGTTGSTGATTSATGGTSTSVRSGASGSTAQMSTENQPQFNAADGTLGDQVGQGGFAGRSNTTFAGSRNAGQGANAGLTPQFGQFGNTQQNTTRRGGAGQSNVKRVRPQQRIAFTFPAANLERTRIELSGRFQRLGTVSGADTTISNDGVATLTGTVKDEDARKLAEALVRLEPGVRSVRNELQVTSPTP